MTTDKTPTIDAGSADRAFHLRSSHPRPLIVTELGVGWQPERWLSGARHHTLSLSPNTAPRLERRTR